MGHGSFDYFEMIDLVSKYYGEGSDQWYEIAKYGLSSDKAYSILQSTPGVEIVKSSNGKVISYNIIEEFSSYPKGDIPTIIDSNIQTGTASLANTTQVSIPANTVVDSTGKVIAESGTKAVSTGSKVATVAGKVATGVACVATGLQLGKVIDSALYNANPDFWDSHNMETLNPDTWGDIVTDDSLLGKAFHVFYGLDENNDTQMYLDENAFAYIANYMQQQGVFTSSLQVNVENISSDFSNLSGKNINNVKLLKTFSYSYVAGGTYRTITKTITSGNGYIVPYVLSLGSDRILVVQLASNDISGVTLNGNDYYGKGYYTTYKNERILYFGLEALNMNEYNVTTSDVCGTITNSDGSLATLDNSSDFRTQLAYLVLHNMTSASNITGISNQTDATIPTLSNDDTVEQTLQKLKEQLPFLWDNAIENEVIQDNGTTKKYKYVPVGFPDSDKNPTTGNQSQSKTKVGTSSDKKTQDKAVERMSKKKTDPNPPKKNIGSTPIPVIPSGEMDALFTVYNPNLTELKQFGSWLWSSNFFEQLKKLFSDPMQAIIGLHKIYVPTTNLSEKQTIRCGYIDSEVPSYVVANQYTTINCGKVSLLEYFGNVFDYEPYTSVKLYLPFIGIVKLDVSEVMRSTIDVTYHVDVLTGACLAEVKIIRDTAESVLYTFTGNMGVQYPLSSGSYIGIVGGLLGIAGGVVGSLATANPVPLAIGLSAASSSGKLHTDVAHSGNISSNCGAMGIKKPYLIINRPQTQLAKDFEKYQGYPSNYTTTLSNCNGFVQVLEVHVDDIKTATSDEKQSIELLLKQGVIIE